MGISRDNWHKRRPTGGKRKPLRKKRKFELGRPPANTKLGPKRIHIVRTRGGNKKYRALRLDHGNFSWGSECCTRKTRIIDVVYNASNNELVRTKTLVKNAIVVIDATPFRQWYESHYALPLVRKKSSKLTEAEEAVLNKKKSKKVEKKYKARQKNAKVEPILEEQFNTSRLLACISSRPGQCGRADGYVLEGKELEFYQRKIRAKKGKITSPSSKAMWWLLIDKNNSKENCKGDENACGSVIPLECVHSHKWRYQDCELGSTILSIGTELGDDP